MGKEPFGRDMAGHEVQILSGPAGAGATNWPWVFPGPCSLIAALRRRRWLVILIPDLY